MDFEIHLLGFSILILILAMLLLVSNYRKKPTAFKKGFKKERRAHSRYKTSLRVKYITSVEEGISWIKDISEKGARLFLNSNLKTLEIGESLGIEINVPYDLQSIIVRANIVWLKEDDAGINFSNVAQGDINRVIQYIKDGEPVATPK